MEMTQAEFAAAIEVKEGSLAAWETDRARPRSRDIVEIAKRIEVITNISASWLLGITDGQRPPHPPGQSFRPPRQTERVRQLRPVADVAGDRQPELVTVEDRWSWYTEAIADQQTDHTDHWPVGYVDDTALAAA